MLRDKGASSQLSANYDQQQSGSILHRGKFKIENRTGQNQPSFAHPQDVATDGVPQQIVTIPGVNRTGVYSTMVAAKTDDADRKKTMKKNQSIKGLIRAAATRD